MKNRRALFFIIIGLSVGIVVLAWLAERLGLYTLSTRQVEVVSIQVAVPPLLADWAEGVAQDFNGRNADAQVSIVSIDGLGAVSQFANSPTDALPHGWIPEATFVADIAQEQGLSFKIDQASIVATDLAWGAFDSRANTLSTVDWQTVHSAATSSGWGAIGGEPNWGFFKLTIASPTSNAEGLAALLSATAAYHNRPQLSRNDVTSVEFTRWLEAVISSVPNFNTLGPEPALTMAARGPSVGDVGLLSGAAWSRAGEGLQKWGDFVQSAPSYTVRLDYPYLVRSSVAESETNMAERFGDYLQGERDTLVEIGFDGQATNGATQVEAETSAVLALLRWAERERVGQ